MVRLGIGCLMRLLGVTEAPLRLPNPSHSHTSNFHPDIGLKRLWSLLNGYSSRKRIKRERDLYSSLVVNKRCFFRLLTYKERISFLTKITTTVVQDPLHKRDLVIKPSSVHSGSPDL